jgi:hypothetical protein
VNYESGSNQRYPTPIDYIILDDQVYQEFKDLNIQLMRSYNSTTEQYQYSIKFINGQFNPTNGGTTIGALVAGNGERNRKRSTHNTNEKDFRLSAYSTTAKNTTPPKLESKKTLTLDEWVSMGRNAGLIKRIVEEIGSGSLEVHCRR